MSAGYVRVRLVCGNIIITQNFYHGPNIYEVRMLRYIAVITKWRAKCVAFSTYIVFLTA